MSGVAGDHFGKLHVFPCRCRRNGMSHHPDNETDDPEPKAQPQGRCQGAIENGNATGSATQKDGISERPIERDFKAGEMGRGT